eukprot:XP_011668978.1 PREDICTED: uncharacterized protein LOC763563 [Strongylocentrotus purpuratus]
MFVFEDDASLLFKHSPDDCPSLASVLSEDLHNSVAETKARDGASRMRYIAVNQSKEDTYTVTMENGGLDIIHEGACSAVQNTWSEVTITLECSSTVMELSRCAMDVRNFLFKFKLVHPSISVGLSSTSDELLLYNFGEEQLESASVCHGINMITDPRYFIISDGVEGAPCHHLSPVSEGSFVFLSPSLSTSESPLSLRCVAVATLVPPPSRPSAPLLQAQAVTPSQLWLSVYGPGSFPLAHPAWSPMETQLNLKHLVKWEDLGLALAGGELEAGPGSLNLPIRDCFKPDLQAFFCGCTKPCEPSHIIHLMLFLKENFKGCAMTAPNRLALLNRVRQEFPRICAQQLSRIQKIIHDTLAKLLGSSRPARKDRAAIMKSAVPSIKSSLHKIISHSTNDAFRRRCLDSVQASNCLDLTDRLSRHLNALCERPPGHQGNDHSQSAVDSQRQFPCEGDDEDGGRVPSDDSNLVSSSSSWMPHHQETAAPDTLLTEESEEDADFDLLDETRLQHCDSMEVNQDAIPALCSVPRPSSCPQRNQDQSSPFVSTLPVNPSSTLPSLSASSRLLPSSSAQAKKQARPSASNQSTSCSSSSLPPGSSSHVQPCEGIPYHGNMTADGMDASSGRPDAGPAHGDEQKRNKVQDNDVQMMQESLSGELGNDWFETLMDHDDWMSNEI